MLESLFWPVSNRRSPELLSGGGVHFSVTKNVAGGVTVAEPGAEPGSEPGSEPGAEPAARAPRGDIEGLRAIAVLAVIAYHFKFAGFSGGYIGVDVFFVISGFLITGRLIGHGDETRRVDFVDFYARRVRRILPLATVVICSTVLVASRFQNPLAFAGGTIPVSRAAAMFFSNVELAGRSTSYLAEASQPSLFQQFWSLSVEEQFYFVWPAIVAVSLWIGRTRKRNIATPIVCVLVGVSFVASVRMSGSNPIDAFFRLESRAWEFGVGAIVALIANSLVALPQRFEAPISAFGLVAVGVSIVSYGGSTRWPGALALAPVLGTALVLLAGLRRQNIVNRAIANAPFRLVGKYSYALYLWHWPFAVFTGERGFPRATVALALIATVVLAVVSYHAIEQPFRTSKYFISRPMLSLGVGLTLVAVTVSISYIAQATVGPFDSGRTMTIAARRPGDAPVAAAFVPKNLVPALINGTSEVDQNSERNVSCREVTDCGYGDVNAETKIVIFGDSHAGHWAPALYRAARERGWRVVRLTAASCPSIQRQSPSGKPQSACQRWAARQRSAIRSLRPRLVILSNYMGSSFRPTASAEAGVAAAIRAFSTDTSVVVLSDTPVAPTSVPECLARHLNSARACEPKVSQPRLGQYNRWLRANVEAAGGIFINVLPILCTDLRCPAIAGNVLVYRDKIHITTAFAQSRSGDLVALLVRSVPRLIA